MKWLLRSQCLLFGTKQRRRVLDIKLIRQTKKNESIVPKGCPQPELAFERGFIAHASFVCPRETTPRLSVYEWNSRARQTCSSTTDTILMKRRSRWARERTAISPNSLCTTAPQRFVDAVVVRNCDLSRQSCRGPNGHHGMTFDIYRTRQEFLWVFSPSMDTFVFLYSPIRAVLYNV